MLARRFEKLKLPAHGQMPGVAFHGSDVQLSANGPRVIIFGGMDENGPLGDAHVLDLSDAAAPLWWQLQPAGEPPRPRSGHTATLFGSDIVIVGGSPIRYSAASKYAIDMALLNLVHVEVQTSAAIEARVAREPELNATCSLLSGTRGSPVPGKSALLSETATPTPASLP